MGHSDTRSVQNVVKEQVDQQRKTAVPAQNRARAHVALTLAIKPHPESMSSVKAKIIFLSDLLRRQIVVALTAFPLLCFKKDFGCPTACRQSSSAFEQFLQSHAVVHEECALLLFLQEKTAECQRCPKTVDIIQH